MNTAMEVAAQVGIAAACIGLGVARATFYRAQRPVVGAAEANVPRSSSPRALSVPEQHTIIELLHEPAYVDLSPRPCSPCCSMRVAILPRCPPSTGCCAQRARRGDGAMNSPTPPMPSPSCSPAGRANCGPGISPSSRAGQVGVLSPLRDPRRLQPLRGRLDDRAVESAELAHQLIAATCDKEGIARGATHTACRPRYLDALQAPGAAALRPRCHQKPQPAPRQRRQSVLGSAVQDPEVSARLSRRALTPSSTPVRSARGSSPGTTTPIGTPGSAT